MMKSLSCCLPGFIRLTSLPLSTGHKKASYHVRSASLPCRSHPLICNLEEQIRATRSWAANPEGSSAWIEAGLAHIELLQLALEDFLQLTQTQETLCQATSVDQFLDDLLQLVDAYGSFVSTILTLKECHSNVQSAFRRRDEVGIASSLRMQRKAEKEITQLASVLRSVSKCRHLALSSDAKEIEIAGIIMEAISATALASMALFTGVGTLSAATSSKKSPGFIRSTSLPLSPSHKQTSYHVRSVSLQCRSHPFISNLEEQIHAVQSWAANPEGSSVWIEAGLAQIELLQIAMEDFLQLSQTQETLRQAASVNQLLDDLLQLVDAYGSFVSNILTLKECHSNVQSAIRRRDETGIASSLRSQRDVEKEIAQLASGLRGLSKCQHQAISSDTKEIEIAGIIVEAICANAFASMAVFTGVAKLSAAASSQKSPGAMRSLKKLIISASLKKRSTGEEENIVTFQRFEELDVCTRYAECFSERVFRSLIKSRVSLLNITTS